MFNQLLVESAPLLIASNPLLNGYSCPTPSQILKAFGIVDNEFVSYLSGEEIDIVENSVKLSFQVYLGFVHNFICEHWVEFAEDLKCPLLSIALMSLKKV